MASVVAGGCIRAPGDEGDVAKPPAINKADGLDSADRDCVIVLDRVDAPSGAGAWMNHVDVRADAFDQPVEVRVLHRTNRDDIWFDVLAMRAYESESTRPGYVRFVTQRLLLDAAIASDYRAELVPFLSNGETGARLFDHNRNPGDLDNYVLDATNGWSIPADASCHRAGA